MSVKGLGFSFKSFNFPCGERHIVIKDVEELPSIQIKFLYEKNEDIIELLLLADAVHNLGLEIEELIMPYVPFSRQDRISVPGESFSLKTFCNLINGIKAKKVMITDPHSDVAVALLNNCEAIYQHEIFSKYLYGKQDFYLVSPDGGALKKIYKLAAITKPLGVIECSKKRDVVTGEITGVRATFEELTHGKDFYIVDDICDGGKTFIEIAKKLKSYSPNKIVLMVSHGFFTKGLEVFEGLIDEVYTRNGRVL